MTRKIPRILISMFLLIGLTFIPNGPPVKASTSPFSGRAMQRTGAVYYGGYFFDNYGQANLNSNYSIQTGDPFITNEMWNMFGTDSEYWIELGEMDGSILGNYWAGHFTAEQTSYGYSEYPLGSMSPPAGNSFEIQKTGSNLWTVYVNGQNLFTWNMPYSVVRYFDVGIESNSDSALFTNGMYNTSMQYLNSSSTWVRLGSTTPINENNFNWLSVFNSSLNRITYTH